MTRRALLVILIGLGLGGCARPSSGTLGIPTGHWSGQGRVVLTCWRATPEYMAPTDHGYVDKSYPTSLKIDPAPDRGDGALRVEIRSDHGGVMRHLSGGQPKAGLVDDRTHLIFYLVPAAGQHSDQVRLYRMMAARSSVREGQWDDRRDPPGEVHASSFVVDGVTVLRIYYVLGMFADTLRFEGDRVHKDGMMFGMTVSDPRFIDWSEILDRE